MSYHCEIAKSYCRLNGCRETSQLAVSLLTLLYSSGHVGFHREEYKQPDDVGLKWQIMYHRYLN